MKVGIYNRFWNTLGGGEKHAGQIAQYLSSDHSVDLIATEVISKTALEQRLYLDLHNCSVCVLEKTTDSDVADHSAAYDLWINTTYLSSVVPKAKKSIYLVFFPALPKIQFALWQLFPKTPPLFIQRAIWPNYGYWKAYDLLLANSSYTQTWIRRWWRADSSVLHPPIDLIGMQSDVLKEKKILSVGRFFLGSHSKKQEILIDNFKRLCDKNREWEFHVCGGTHSEKIHQEYLRSLQSATEGFPIFIRPDIKRTELLALYRTASLFWHATGYGMDVIRNPSAFEHFGITTVEAMSAGCVPVVINKAGQCEIVKSGKDGFLWNTLDEQIDYTRELMTNHELFADLSRAAVLSSKQYSVTEFNRTLSRLLHDAKLV